MIFGRKNTQQMKDMVEEVLTEALRQQSRELDAQQAGQVRQLNDMMEKNQKAVRGFPTQWRIFWIHCRKKMRSASV